MKITKLFILLAVPFFLVSCSGGDDTTNTLQVSFTTTRAFLIDTGSRSCVSQLEGTGTDTVNDVSGPFFTLRNPQISWSLEGKSVSVAYIKLKAKSRFLGGDEYECTIAEDEMFWMFAQNASEKWNGLIEAPAKGETKKLKSLACVTLRCGDVQIKNPAKGFAANVTVEIFGVAIDSEGIEEPVRGFSNVIIENRP